MALAAYVPQGFVHGYAIVGLAAGVLVLGLVVKATEWVMVKKEER